MEYDIKKIKNFNGYIFTLPPTVNFLLKNNVIPDFIILGDSSYYNIFHLKKSLRSKIILITDLSVHYSLLSKWKGNKILFSYNIPGFDYIYKNLNIDYIPQDDFDLYHHGVSEYWQLPRETIYTSLGDCEDHAILLASLLRANGWFPNNVWVVLGYKVDNEEEKWHAWVNIKIGSLWYNIESTGGLLYAILGSISILMSLMLHTCLTI